MDRMLWSRPVHPPKTGVPPPSPLNYEIHDDRRRLIVVRQPSPVLALVVVVVMSAAPLLIVNPWVILK